MKLIKLNAKIYEYFKRLNAQKWLCYHLIEYTYIISLSELIILHLDTLYEAAFNISV